MTDVAERRKRQEKAGGWGETIRTVVYAVLIALVVRTFAIEPFNIPSGSMIPTLLVGDYLFVSKYSYGYSKHSFPFSLGFFSGRIFGHAPERGDVAVFKYPGDQARGANRTRDELGWYVPAENLVGRAEFIFFSHDPSAAGWLEPWKWPQAIRFSRFFQAIH